MSDFIVHTNEGDKPSAEFLEELSWLVWPPDSDMVEFALEDDDKGCLSVTYVIEPFDISKTIDYEVSVYPNELRVSCIGAVPLGKTVDLKELAVIVGSRIYEDFRSEIW